MKFGALFSLILLGLSLPTSAWADSRGYLCVSIATDNTKLNTTHDGRYFNTEDEAFAALDSLCVSSKKVCEDVACGFDNGVAIPEPKTDQLLRVLLMRQIDKLKQRVESIPVPRPPLPSPETKEDDSAKKQALKNLEKAERQKARESGKRGSQRRP